jgi:hypothetical protein
MISQGIVVQFSEGARDFTCLQTAQTVSEAHPSSHSVREYSDRGVKPTAHLRRVLRLRIFTPLTPSWWVLGQLLFLLPLKSLVN